MALTESTPLLSDNGEAGRSEEVLDNGKFTSELWFLVETSIPVIAAYALQNSIQTVTILIAGRLGPDALSAAAFALMLAGVTGWCVALGGTTALDTLGSQSYTYSGRDPAAILPHLIRCIIILWGLLIPILVLWFFASPILLFLGQQELLSNDVQAFLRVLIFGAPSYIGFESVKKYLQCQGIMHASTLVLLVTSPFNALISYLLIHRTSLGFLGAPLAVSITYHVSFILLIVYAKYGPVPRRREEPATSDATTLPSSVLDQESRRTIPSTISSIEPTTSPQTPSRKPDMPQFYASLEPRHLFAPAPVKTFFLLALPGIFMVATEWWAFEIVALAAGRLGRLSLAAQSVVMTADQVLYNIPFGLSVATSARIGNLIGARRSKHAQLSAHTAAFLSVCSGSVVMVSLLAERNAFGYLFSDDRIVAGIVSNIMPLVASFQVADGLANSCGGVLRGQGRQHLGAACNLVAYYVIALPLGLTLAFRLGFGLPGLWVGQVVGLFIVGLGEYVIVWRFTDWDEEVKRGIARVST